MKEGKVCAESELAAYYGGYFFFFLSMLGSILVSWQRGGKKKVSFLSTGNGTLVQFRLKRFRITSLLLRVITFASPRMNAFFDKLFDIY